MMYGDVMCVAKVFYQICAGASMLPELGPSLGLQSASEHAYSSAARQGSAPMEYGKIESNPFKSHNPYSLRYDFY